MPEPQQRRIPDPLSEARDQTHNLMVTRWIDFHCATTGGPTWMFLKLCIGPQITWMTQSPSGQIFWKGLEPRSKMLPRATSLIAWSIITYTPNTEKSSRSSRVAQRVKDPALSLQRLRSLLWQGLGRCLNKNSFLPSKSASLKNEWVTEVEKLIAVH